MEIDSLDNLDGYFRYGNNFSNEKGRLQSCFHMDIFSFPPEAMMYFADNSLSRRNVVPSHSNSIQEINLVSIFGRDGGGASAKGGVTVTWGGSEGTQYTSYASAEVYDGKGNHAEANITQNSDGTGSATISVGHDSDSTAK